MRGIELLCFVTLILIEVEVIVFLLLPSQKKMAQNILPWTSLSEEGENVRTCSVCGWCLPVHKRDLSVMFAK